MQSTHLVSRYKIRPRWTPPVLLCTWLRALLDLWSGGFYPIIHNIGWLSTTYRPVHNSSQPFPTPKLFTYSRGSRPPSNSVRGYWAHSSPHAKRHLDRFSRFAGYIRVRPERQIDQSTSVANRPHLRYACNAAYEVKVLQLSIANTWIRSYDLTVR